MIVVSFSAYAIVCFLITWVLTVNSESRESYFARRNALLEEESNYMLGGNLQWESETEKRANDILMDYKRREYDEGLAGRNGLHFLATSRNYFHVSKEIEDSNVFKIIKILPKGAALHTHHITTCSVEFIVHRIAYWPNLYLCYNPRLENLEFRFFGSPPTSRCPTDGVSNWTLVSEFRRKSSSSAYVDKLFYRAMSFDTETPEMDYRNSNAAWRKFAKQIVTLTGILGYVEALRACYENALQEFYDDNVMYIELRSKLIPFYFLDQSPLTEKQVLAIFEEVTLEFRFRNPKFFGAKLILTASRNSGQQKVAQSIETAIDLKRSFPDFFAGFDLVSHEDTGPTSLDYINQLLVASNKGLKFFFHAGETDWHGTRVDDNMMEAILLNATRIGHGTALNGRPLITDMIYKNKIGLEVNPISGQILRFNEDFRTHPIIPFLHSDFPIVISSDDPGIWRSSGLSYDWYFAFMGMGGARADLRFLKQLALNSINYSAMSKGEKRIALREWRIKWEAFIIKVLATYPTSNRP